MIIPQEASKSGTYNSLQNIGNVTVFIHGFNVPEGEFGRYIDDIKIVTPPQPQGPEFSGSNQMSNYLNKFIQILGALACSILI